MKNIDTAKPVLVTGANGYIASWLVKLLLESGITVHAAVRDPKDDKKNRHLREIAANCEGTIRFFKADLLEMGSYDAAMLGCELVFHTASPFHTDVKDPEKELVEPAVQGTENVLQSALKISSVKRVVVTSSMAALYTDAIDAVNAANGILTEDIWNSTASLSYQPYPYSKTLAERRAWELAGSQSRFDLVTINPSMVLGPPLSTNYSISESLNFLKLLGNGGLKQGVPKIGIGVVDVRDVAVAHFKAGFLPKAKGRYITSGHNTDMLEIAKSLLPKYGNRFPIPKRALSKCLLMLIGPVANKMLTRDFVRKNINIPWNADNSKIKADLGITFRPMQQTIEEGFQVLVDMNALGS
ncbi:NAD-dependent epimerase/dehydratase family protein [Flavobacterium sp. LPB0248]|uniref:NAD-dependent epimerase/dehydratase family protein n=1 Tax=Flavobacterium sp. LPB0248 TaxID=2614441 RepID=UPI0015A5E2F0|nr:NAD-dependent epimerase/dehydratase family protein [Flavobacterium sp. LPB0248]QLC64779.1 NAD-dependent epimerase/dehydratase family protein [Flavobacterium sp. LPB0248]